MELRDATEDDSDRIRAVAEQSFQTSYKLSPLEIETIVEAEFEAERIADRIEDDGHIMLVAESDDVVLGFAEASITDDGYGEILWLHVDPGERGNGVGTELTEQLIAELRERTVAGVRGLVLGKNEEGSEFFERFEFERSGQTERNFDGEPFQAEVHSNVETEQTDEDEYTVPESEEIDVEGEARFIDSEESIAGIEGEFLIVFETEERENRYGFFCTNCGTFTDSVDGDGKVVCEECGNVHNPDEWDGSYL